LYLTLVHSYGIRVPSWLVSDGTLRLLALTLLAYIDQQNRVYLIEEPENGIHPQAVQTVYQSLSSAYESQVLVASHSPVFLSLAEPSQILCFSRTQSGATDIVLGSEHPRLRDWQGEVLISDYFASGVLG
jgi:predicted ATPase